MKAPLTELDIRLRLKKDEHLRSLSVPEGTLVTPSAADFLKMNRIELVFGDAPSVAGQPDTAAPAGRPAGAVVYIGPAGEELDYKPERLTHLHGNQLCEKDHPRIVFRGKLDKLAAMIIEAQALGAEKENVAYINDLQEILNFFRSLLPAEYKGEALGTFHLLGLSSRDLRERSHHTDKYFGRKHLLVHHSMGLLSIRLNTLRTLAREAELAAVSAFKAPFSDTSRDDIVEALNRLSSLFYILMYKYLPRNYIDTGDAGI
jgi:ethanolamine utilization cobalamin adenosyltransferase